MPRTSIWNSGVSHRVGGVSKLKPEYTQWYGVLNRVDKNLKGYSSVTVSDNFRSYDYWCEWVKNQKGYGNRENGALWAIDKDIVGDGTIYHEDVCVFVPPILNSFFTNRVSGKYPRGVHTNCAKYRAYSCEFHKEIRLGAHDTIEDAVYAYQDRRVDYLFRLMDIYGDQVDERVFPALLLNLTNSFVVPDIR